ncbi:polysaccharide biosynthesis/export family protein [Adhaeribacter rhizoryzae]|uniref:Polysaccharide export protein EpsE n=1 Tax=Adhaeribacter rhizoryzae TaxID=2607907 RepID=A0A5M6CZR0_9BACT|nr:polysaccharide biosynthesis/export family protein [Adhaeribacter rhizoryzae]KAA5540346.1 polysaccharide export protein EpsE [Adhaeribacter rhizoryzae]
MQAILKPNLLRLFIILFALSFYSCRSYNQNIMFRGEGSVNLDKLKQSLANVERNYIIQPNDYLDVRVYTNKGERIFDPNGELPFGAPGGGASQRGGNRTSGGQNNQISNSQFLVQYDGRIKLPMVDYVKVTGLTLLQADSLLQTLYATYYVDPFVTTQVTNNRVFVLGSPGGQVIPMTNDNMNLLEVIALAGGVDGGRSGGGTALGQSRFGRADKIKIIRNYMDHDPIVQVVDLTTIAGLKQASLHIEPNDVIYIEPNQRLFFEVFREIAPIVSTVLGTASAIITTVLLVNNLK